MTPPKSFSEMLKEKVAAYGTETAEKSEYIKIKEATETKRWDINILAKILDIGDIKNFERKDGTKGRLRNIVLGDETGKASMTIWDDAVDTIHLLGIK